MKNAYTLLLAFATTFTFAQQTISFETGEGYQLGSLNTQNGWEVTEDSDGVVLNQVVSDEKASNGSLSFKNAYEPDFDFQFFPIFGASKTFNEPADYSDFIISYDVLVTEKLGSDFEFTLFAIDNNDNFVPVAGVGIENRGFIYTIKDVDYGFDYAESEWTPNEWVNVKIEVTETEIKYYINNSLQNTVANFTQLDIVGLTMLHNNYGNDAYYDNFVITNSVLGTKSFDNTSVSIYPNPAENQISLALSDDNQLVSVEIYSLVGQKLLETNQVENINISHFASGTYVLKAIGIDGTSNTRKIIKK